VPSQGGHGAASGTRQVSAKQEAVAISYRRCHHKYPSNCHSFCSILPPNPLLESRLVATDESLQRLVRRAFCERVVNLGSTWVHEIIHTPLLWVAVWMLVEFCDVIGSKSVMILSERATHVSHRCDIAVGYDSVKVGCVGGVASPRQHVDRGIWWLKL
jgi:hypothetical protein